MKTLKLLGIAIASLGVAASVGGAVALYTQNAQNATLGIGAGTYSGSTGKLTYKIDGKTSGSVAPKYYSLTDAEGTGLTQEFCQVKYEFPLSATFDEELNAQTYVHGHLGISITNIPAKYQGHLSIWSGIEGYDNTKHGYAAFHDCFGGNYEITNEATAYEKGHDVSVTAAGGQSLVIWVKYSFDSELNYLELDEEGLGYTLSVTWGVPTDPVAYVVGTGNSWKVDEDFAMAKNINADYEKDEWIYEGLAADASWSRAKCITNTEVWSGGLDAELEAGKTYNVYWAGTNDAQAYFVEA